MAVMTFNIDEVAGMVARLDIEEPNGKVLLIAGQQREADETLKALAHALGGRGAGVSLSTKRKTLMLKHGLLIIDAGKRPGLGMRASMVITTSSASAEEMQNAHLALVGTQGHQVALRSPTAPHEAAQTRPDASQDGDTSENPDNPA